MKAFPNADSERAAIMDPESDALSFGRDAVRMCVQVWPVSFEVGFIAPDGISGPGRLEVEPGAIRCVPTFFLGRVRANRTWTHTDREVNLYVARLVPPWFNVALSLHDGAEPFAASTWLPGRRRLADTVLLAGFAVSKHRTWLYRGTPHG